MAASVLALVTAFAVVFVAELPDKTMVATLLLTTRYRAWPVFVGVVTAFAVQCAVAVAFGSVLTLLPDRVVAAVVALLFGAGAFLLLREGFSTRHSERDASRPAPRPVPFWRAALASFGVLFAAEWGDASQLATAGLTARYGAPLPVGLGSWLALVAVATIAVLVGHKISDRIPAHLLQRIAGFVFTGFAALALWHAIG